MGQQDFQYNSFNTTQGKLFLARGDKFDWLHDSTEHDNNKTSLS